MKWVKRITAAAMAAVIAAGALGLSASADVNSEVTYYDWYARHVGGPNPDSVDTVDRWTMAASTSTYTGYCSNMVTDAATRSLNIYSTSHTMVNVPGYKLTSDKYLGNMAVFNAAKTTIKWKIESELEDVSYVAYCNANASCEARGYVKI